MSKVTLNTKNLPAPIKRRRYYTPYEVKNHCTSNDCWISIFNVEFQYFKIELQYLKHNFSLKTYALMA